MRHLVLFAFLLSFCALAPPASAQDEFTGVDVNAVKAKNASEGAAPAAAATPAAPSAPSAAPEEDNEFSGVDIDAAKKKAEVPRDDVPNEFTNMTSMEDRDPDKPPPVDEYNDIPTSLMIPTEAVASAAGQTSGIRATSGKLTFETLLKYYKEGKFDEVAKELEPLAHGGHRGAQELMGVMYRQGQGVTKDPKKAFDYLSQAADANRPLAQHHLGIMYFQGEGVPADAVMALMWVQIAIVHYSDGAEKDRAMQDRDNMYTHLTRREKDRAVQYARDWLNKRGEAHLLDLQGL